MAMIDNLGKIYYNFNKNLLVDDTKKAEKYTQIEKVQYKESELKSGKLNFLSSKIFNCTDDRACGRENARYLFRHSICSLRA